MTTPNPDVNPKRPAGDVLQAARRLGEQLGFARPHEVGDEVRVAQGDGEHLEVGDERVEHGSLRVDACDGRNIGFGCGERGRRGFSFRAGPAHRGMECVEVGHAGGAQHARELGRGGVVRRRQGRGGAVRRGRDVRAASRQLGGPLGQPAELGRVIGGPDITEVERQHVELDGLVAGEGHRRGDGAQPGAAGVEGGDDAGNGHRDLA